MKLALLAGLLCLQDAPAQIFNGKDLSGWVKVNGGDWAVEDGALVLTGTGGNGWLRSEKTYKDFEVSFEWKTALEKYDSGFYIRALDRGAPWPKVGIQVNLLTGREGEGVGLKDAKAKPDLIKKGDWNLFVIRAQGRTVSLKANGQEVWTSEDPSPRDGHFGFQAEGKRVEFRNVKVAVLPSE